MKQVGVRVCLLQKCSKDEEQHKAVPIQKWHVLQVPKLKTRPHLKVCSVINIFQSEKEACFRVLRPDFEY